MYGMGEFLKCNQVKVAVHRAGGQTKAANILQVSSTTIQNWIKSGRVPDINKAKTLAKLSGLDLQQLRSTW
jgi:DNA-binding transcriptional regulator YdaS (Cro superfamily)